jgi:hypothetical protein
MSTSTGTRRATTATRTPRITPRQQAVNATERLRETLHLPEVNGDANAFTTALAEVAARESRQNGRFAEEVRTRYRELTAQLKEQTGRTRAAPLADLVPIRRIEGYRADPFSPPDPLFLTQLYGRHQLRSALEYYTLDMLKMTADRVQAEHPGTRPANRGRKAAVIDYIVKYSAE